ncbi:OmpA family protein [Flavobacterium sp. SUN046]|uniref:OmpA family protein n=1 Tax=Flavobacterium sp. SUN046 TaxID=3002440 RepID=UPI002DB9081C|nr:OmpA family protein [Flavobacterium sp. SUN046]MEC4047949.1 OmpA family protein [Flavobacterium sp. SUN046]
MKKIFITTVLLCITHSIQAQEVYFYSGKNFTTYNFKNSSGNSNPNLKSGTGSFYEVGYNKNLKYDRFSYSLAVALNEYNNIGGNSANSYSWNTQYLGAQTRLYYSYLKGKTYDLLSTIGLNASSLLSGKQQINGTYYDLTKEKEFTGFLLSPSIGLQFKYNVANLGYVSLGYNYIKSYNLSNTTNQKLGFTTNQLQFGVHFELKSKNANTEPVATATVYKDTPKSTNQKVEVEVSIVDKTKDENTSSKSTDPNKVTVEVVISDKREASNTVANDKNTRVVSIDNTTSNTSNSNSPVTDSVKSFKVSEKDPFSNSTEKSAFNFSAKGLSILQVDDDIVNKSIQYLMENPSKTLVLNGYSSSDGLNKANYALSLKRAFIAKEYLILKGVPESRIEAIGRGASNPKYSNTTLEGRLKNKRVEIEFK